MKLFRLAVIIIMICSFSLCQKKSSDNALEKHPVQDSVKIDSAVAIEDTSKYPPEPEGYKGIHQEEKEKYDDMTKK